MIHKSIKRTVATKLPMLYGLSRYFKKRFVLPLRREMVRMKAKQSKLHVDPYAMQFISPFTIKNTIYGPADVPNPAAVSGMIKGGNWDRNTLSIMDLDIVRAARDRFKNNMEWRDTEYYKNHLDRILKGDYWRGCKTTDDLDAYCLRFDELYYSIKNHGYIPESSILRNKYGATGATEHEITVHIDRNGHYLLCDGRHRFAIALVLGIKEIPVKACIRHADWQTFCFEIMTVAKNNGGKVYAPLTHPDLQSIPSAHGEERYRIIAEHVQIHKGDLLDIGAHWGYFCHLFEDLGFNCYAVESSPENLYFLEKLRDAQDRRFPIIGQSIFAYKEKNTFDVVLALNIFHHFLKTEAAYHSLIEFLNRIDMKMMFFEPHNTTDNQMQSAYRNYSPEEFINFIFKHSCLKHCTQIDKAKDGRSIYKMWK